MSKRAASGDLWVFGYGSLMWRPGFVFAEAVPARLQGWHRCFCIYSTHHRGSPKRPGLVLGLDRGGTCDGIAYRVSGEGAAATLAYLRAREQVNGVYREALVELSTPDVDERAGHAQLRALAFVVERAHPSYAGALPLATQAALIRGAEGLSGANVDYLVNTLAHMDGLGIGEPELARLLVLIGGYFRHREADGKHGVRARSAALLRACRWYGVPVRRLHKGERRRFIHRGQLEIQRGLRYLRPAQ